MVLEVCHVMEHNVLTSAIGKEAAKDKTMDEQKIRESLERDLYSQEFESTQRHIKEKREKLAQAYQRRGLYHSGPHAKAVIDSELESLKKLVNSYFDILKRVYFKTKDPDEKFLRTKIEELYHGRIRASKQSLSDYLPRLGAGERAIDNFEREAAVILSRVLRNIRVAASESLLEKKKTEPEKQHNDISMTMNEKRRQFLLKLNELSEGEVTKFIDTLGVGESLGFDRALTFNCANYYVQKGYIEPREEALGTISITAAGIDDADRIQSIRVVPSSSQRDLPEERYFSPGSHLGIQKYLARVLRMAKASLWICDPYMDEKIVEEISNVGASEIRLLTSKQKGLFSQRLAAAKLQFPEKKIEAKIYDKCHDRYYFIDKEQVWTLGASYNKAGEKATLLSMLKDETERQKIMNDFEVWWGVATEIKT
ncbi:MAG: hypothetical protein A2026_07670 [Deltaproteobacteria bacterium RBG_19FT_COMBO_46_12]|nr:MAG: hypothetical protein A2026_07670 [Deltaproteobacteria bacterium RBG_19FT_COMBO_46_12]